MTANKLGSARRLSAVTSSAARTPGSSWAMMKAALLRLWREKRGEVEPEDLSGNLIVQLGVATEDLNRRWYEANSGQVITDVQTARPPSGLALDGGHPGRPGGSPAARCSRPSSCCPGRSRKRRPPRNTCRSCSTTCGSWRHGRRSFR